MVCSVCDQEERYKYIKYKSGYFHKIVAATGRSLSGQAAKVELFPFIAATSQLQRSQVIREPHEMCSGSGGGVGTTRYL